MITHDEAFDQIVTAFLQTWHEEHQLLPTRIADLDDTEFRTFLSRYDPTYAKLVERLTIDERVKTLENVALAYAVAKAILKAHEILHQDI